mmetsp:Transcript_48327/g.117600  ORF Transcript_48327/g.117600 Transcript_48327/m.117600 type:complete len:226 (+) Transcript_48327:1505-2182(+)
MVNRRSLHDEVGEQHLGDGALDVGLLLFLLFLGRVGSGFFVVVVVELDAHRPHRLAHDVLGQLVLALAGQQFHRRLVRQHHQHVAADGRHIGLDLVGEVRVLDLQRHADLGEAVDVLVGQVDGERVERNEGGRLVALGMGLGLHRGLGGLGAFLAVLGGLLLQQHQGRAAAGQHQHQHRGDDDDQLFAAASLGGGGSFGSRRSRHENSLNVHRPPVVVGRACPDY